MATAEARIAARLNCMVELVVTKECMSVACNRRAGEQVKSTEETILSCLSSELTSPYLYISADQSSRSP